MNDFTVWHVLVVLLVLGIFLVFYFIPAIIAKSRDTANVGLIFFLNLFIGWTMLGWLVVLLMAMLGQTKAQRAFYENQRNYGGYPPPPYGPPPSPHYPPQAR